MLFFDIFDILGKHFELKLKDEGTDTLLRFLQFSNEFSSILSIEGGSTSFVNLIQFLNELQQILFKQESSSKIISSSSLHPLKVLSFIASTALGMEIFFNDLHSWKQYCPMDETEGGILISSRRKHFLNAPNSIFVIPGESVTFFKFEQL